MSIHAVAIPKWGIEMENGTVTEWHSSLGDNVTQGDELVDLESDKIVNTLEATASGVLRRVFADVDDTMEVGELMGVIADADVSDDAIDEFVAKFNAARGEEGEADSADAAPVTAQAQEPTAAAAETEAPGAVAPAPAADSNSGEVRVSPPVRRKAEKLGVDISTVVGSGPGGRITSEDIERAAAGSPAGESSSEQASDAAPSYTSTKLTATQQTISRRLVESKQTVPHFYLGIDIELDALLAKRSALNSEQSQKVSINDMIVWATARALMAVPQINAQLVGDEIRQFGQADISVAVATERGLLTPVLKAVDQMSPVEVAAAIAELVDKAKNAGLAREDIEGGSFTISNLGMYGVSSFDAIINPPQVAILALGQAQKQVVVKDSGETAVATVLSASLSSDHRVVDGALGGTFLSALKKEIESIA